MMAKTTWCESVGLAKIGHEAPQALDRCTIAWGQAMSQFTLQMKPILALLVASSLAIGITFPSTPAFADNEKHEKQKERDRDRDRQGAASGMRVAVDVRIGEPDRVIIRDYYGAAVRSGHCPPGLAKKNNGCMPPGQAKKWRQGEPLPRDVVFHDLPPALTMKLTLPPSGYRYVRVANDVLMIAAGTGLVVDAIRDLGSM
jgi:Ni/Co efflux regulator RcnB